VTGDGAIALIIDRMSHGSIGNAVDPANPRALAFMPAGTLTTKKGTREHLLTFNQLLRAPAGNFTELPCRLQPGLFAEP